MADAARSGDGAETLIDIAAECPHLLAEADIAVSEMANHYPALMLEGATVLGFLLTYPVAADVLARWRQDADALVAAHQFGLRRAQAKAWNTYLILLAGGTPSYAEQVALSAIEEDLSGTRKIARAGVVDLDGLRSALLPLLPIQNSPRLDSVDMRGEIRLRTTELPIRTVDAFLSKASVSVVAQMLEELP